MRKLLVLLITFLFLVSGASISNEYGKEKEGMENERVVATIIFTDNNCSLSTLQPIVVITQPEDGAVVTDPHLVVLGYASDENGMNYWEWEWRWEGGSKSNSSYFEPAEYVEFRIDIYGLHSGWNLITVRFKSIYEATGEDCVNVTYNPPNTPPNKPPTPEGPTEGKVKETLYFNTVTTDPDGDSLEYLIDWGDGTNTGWLGPITSGTPFQNFHAWDEPGTYEVKAKARDLPYLEESEWSDPLTVTIYENDTEPPVVVKEYPPDGATFTEPNITAWGYITDNVGVVSYGYTHEWEGGTTGSSWPLEEPTTNFSFEIPMTLHEGWNRIKIEASDAAGNYGYDEETVYYNATEGLEIRSVFQPVQVVWQDAPAPPRENSNRLKEIEAGKHYKAQIPMIKGKNTLLFGYPYNKRFKINVSITNNYAEDRKIKLQFKIQPGNKVVYTYPKVITVKKTKTVTIDTSQGVPDKPFQWKKNGKGKVVLEAISADKKELTSNNVTVDVDIKETHGFSILYIPIRLENTRMVYLVADVDKMIETSDEFIQGTYPVPEDSIFGRDLLGEIAREALPGARAEDWLKKYIPQLNFGSDPSNTNQFLNKLQTILIQLSKIASKMGYKRAVGLVPEGWFRNHMAKNAPKYTTSIGISWPPKVGNIPTIVEYSHPTAVAHEIAHTFGLNLPKWNSSTGKWESTEEYDVHPEYRAYGYWVNKGSKGGDRKNCFCFMNSANPITQTWVCTPTYTELVEALQKRDPPSLFLCGTAYRNNTIVLEEIFWIPQGYVDIVEGEEGNYSVVLMRNGVVLAEYNFTINFYSPLGGESVYTVDSVPFAFRVPWINGTEVVQIQDEKKNVLADLEVSPNTPQVTVTYPNGGEEINLGNCTITWNAYDADGDDLTYDVMISMDGGENWIPIGMDLTKNSYTCDFSIFPSGSSYLMKVLACDGVNTGQDTSDSTFTILPDTTPPTVELVKPRNGLYLNDRKIIPSPFTVIIGGVTIEADASDDIGISNVSFYVDDEFKNASYISPFTWFWDEFIMGRHEIKIVAYDAAGNTAMDEQKVWIFNI